MSESLGSRLPAALQGMQAAAGGRALPAEMSAWGPPLVLLARVHRCRKVGCMHWTSRNSRSAAATQQYSESSILHLHHIHWSAIETGCVQAAYLSFYA